MVDESRKWEGVARRRNNAEAAKVPLLAHAGLVPMHTAEQCKDRHDRCIASAVRSQEEMLAKGRARADRYRARLAELVSADVLFAMDDYIKRVLPSGPEYACDFYRHELLSRGVEVEAT